MKIYLLGVKNGKIYVKNLNFRAKKCCDIFPKHK